jgi:uncharacterized repeat protein (TIGR01451 family)
MKPKMRILARGLILVTLLAGLWTVGAYGQTPEGTVIRNLATASWTDANSNTYASVADSVDVTVGFGAGVDVIAGAGSVSPASPSSNDTLYFQVANIGNGADSISVAETISNGSVITVTGYRYSGTTYGTLAALNTALAGVSMAVGDTADIAVVYDVPSAQGGQSTDYTLTATSRRDGGASDADVTTISPPASAGVSVTPDGSQNVQQLPSNGTNYTFQFSLENTGNLDEDFDLLGSSPGSAVITIVSVNGEAGDSARVNIATGATANIDVVYSVADVAAGSADTLQLRARSVTTPATLDDGFMDLTVVRPALTITKEAFRDDQSTPIAAGTVSSGEYIQYRITVTNGGTADASSVHIDDLLPSEVTYDSSAGDAAGWTITESGGDVDADLSGTLAPAASRYIWIRVQVN